MKNKLVAMMFGAVLVLGACGGNDGNEIKFRGYGKRRSGKGLPSRAV